MKIALMRAVAALGVLGMCGINTRANDVATTKPATRPTDITRVQKGRLKLEITAEAVLLPMNPFEVRLRFKAYQGGLSVLNAAPHGAMVKKGELLLECDPAEM